jgi:hypothetical protein
MCKYQESIVRDIIMMKIGGYRNKDICKALSLEMGYVAQIAYKGRWRYLWKILETNGGASMTGQ